MMRAKKVVALTKSWFAVAVWKSLGLVNVAARWMLCTVVAFEGMSDKNSSRGKERNKCRVTRTRKHWLAVKSVESQRQLVFRSLTRMELGIRSPPT